MTDREKLIELAHDYFKSVPWYADIADLNPEELIDHLLTNGVRLESEQATSDENKRWIPVSKRLPEHGKVVLVCGKRGAIYTAWCNTLHKNPGWHKLNSKNHYCDPTHWMPLPTPPKEENND